MKKNGTAKNGADGQRHATWGDIIAVFVAGLVSIGVLVGYHLSTRERDREIDETIQRVDSYLKELDAKDAARRAEELRKQREDHEWWLSFSTNAPAEGVEEKPKSRQSRPYSIRPEDFDSVANSRMTREELIYEIDVLTETLWCEARGEGKRGIEAVASVVYNRSKKSGKSISETCLQRYQFSCWNNRAHPVVGGDRSFVQKKGLNTRDAKLYSACRSVAYAVVIGKFAPTVDATHYYAHKKVRPKWADKMWGKTVIGNHTFGRV